MRASDPGILWDKIPISMDATHPLQQALAEAIARLLRPLCRVLLRHNVSFGAFEELAKRAYIDVALHEFGIPGKKPSISRASILSGLTRKEVQRLASLPRDAAATVGERYNRAARVLTGWARDRDFVDAAGTPLALPLNAGEPNFVSLVRRHSGDMPARAVLDEMLRVGAVRERDDGRIELIARAYVPQRSAVDKLAILGQDASDLITTIDHNLQHGARDPRFQRKVMYHSVPAAAVPAFRALSTAKAQALLELFDRWLEEHDVGNPPGQPELPRARIGVGIYYFQEDLVSGPADSHGDTA